MNLSAALGGWILLALTRDRSGQLIIESKLTSQPGIESKLTNVAVSTARVARTGQVYT